MIGLSRRCGKIPSAQMRHYAANHTTSPRAFLYKRTNIVSGSFSFLNTVFGGAYLEGYIPRTGIVISKQLPKRWSFEKREVGESRLLIHAGSKLAVYPYPMVHLNKGSEINLLEIVELSASQLEHVDSVMGEIRRIQDLARSLKWEGGLSLKAVSLENPEVRSQCEELWEQLFSKQPGTIRSRIREACS